jgi:hypothetical protein
LALTPLLENQLHMAVWDGAMTATFNGRPIAVQAAAPQVRTAEATRQGVYVINPVAGTSVQVLDFKIRKLDAKPDGMR